MAALHKNGFVSTILHHKPILNPPPWLQEPLVYIVLNWVTTSNFSPIFGLKKGPISPNIGQNFLKIDEYIIKNHITMFKNPYLEIYRCNPFFFALLVMWGTSMWPRAHLLARWAPYCLVLGHVAWPCGLSLVLRARPLIWCSPCSTALGRRDSPTNRG
jgi:hypothetical protein